MTQFAMYATWNGGQTGTESDGVPGSAGGYWSGGGAANGVSAPGVGAAGKNAIYDPLLYPHSYVNNMKSMLAAQWVENSNALVWRLFT